MTTKIQASIGAIAAAAARSCAAITTPSVSGASGATGDDGGLAASPTSPPSSARIGSGDLRRFRTRMFAPMDMLGEPSALVGPAAAISTPGRPALSISNGSHFSNGFRSTRGGTKSTPLT